MRWTTGRSDTSVCIFHLQFVLCFAGVFDRTNSQIQGHVYRLEGLTCALGVETAEDSEDEPDQIEDID